jgi:Bacterial SH3 domain
LISGWCAVPPPRRARAGLSLAAALVLGCGALIASAQPEPTPRPLLPTSTVCESSPQSRMIVAERGRVNNEDDYPINVRTGPNTQNALVAQLPAHTRFYVIEGPECSPRYTWYHIEFEGGRGWVAEGDNDEYYLEPYPPG